MLRLLIVAVIVAVAGCQREDASEADSGTPDVADARALLHELESNSRTLAADTVHIIAPDVDSAATWEGVLLDSTLATLKATYGGRDDGAYALYAVSMPPGRRGFLVRAPSQYGSSAIDLWIYNDSTRRWEDTVRVADAFGDGMWYFVQDGWLVDVNRDRWPDVVTRRRDWWEDDSTGREHQSDSLVIRSGSPQGFGRPRLTTDSLMRRRFDVAHWPNHGSREPEEPGSLLEAATAVVRFLRGELPFDSVRVADTVSLYLGLEEGRTRRRVARDVLRNRTNWRVQSRSLRHSYSFVPPQGNAALTTREGRHLNCLDYALSASFPDLAQLPHVGTTLRYGADSCLQTWNLTLVFDPHDRPWKLVAAVYDQFEW
ncbi:MAG TPA: hypothetical protein VJ650_04830 [Gemmatimonadaceae bacterium]|nr:hypothetical protein [Gemmatimonadaceae bacterium]